MKKRTLKEKFYGRLLSILNEEHIHFMLGGTYAFNEYTGIKRPTKDMDLFCKTGDYQRILQLLHDKKFKVEITDARWLAKAYQGENYVDFIFANANGTCPVDDTWLKYAPEKDFLGYKVKFTAPEEMIWSKSYVQTREKYDGADVYHLMLKQGEKLNWKRLLMRMDPQWELLLAHLIQFRFIYPSDRVLIPKWLLEELLDRVKQQLALPTPHEKICRGPLLSRDQYEIDITKWGYKAIT